MKVLAHSSTSETSVGTVTNCSPVGFDLHCVFSRKAGHDVEIWDAYIERWTWTKLQRNPGREAISVDVIGLSAMTPMWDGLSNIENGTAVCKVAHCGWSPPDNVKHEIFEDIRI